MKLLDAKGRVLWDNAETSKTLENWAVMADIRAEMPRTLALFQDAQEAFRQAAGTMAQSVEAMTPGSAVEGSEANRLLEDRCKVMYEKFYSATVLAQDALDWLNGFFEANSDARAQREAYRREFEECRQHNEEFRKQYENSTHPRAN